MWIPEWGFMSTPASLDARVNGGTPLVLATPPVLPTVAPVALLAPLPTSCQVPCETCDKYQLQPIASAHPWAAVMTQAEVACAVECSKCTQRVIPTTVCGAVALHHSECASPPAYVPCEAAMWHSQGCAGVAAALKGRSVQARCTACSCVFSVDYVYGHAMRMKLRASKDPSASAWATNPTLEAIITLVHEVVLKDIAAKTGILRYDWTPCTTCHTQAEWLSRSCSALAAAHRAALRVGWIGDATSPAPTCVSIPLGVPVLMTAAELAACIPVLASGIAPKLPLQDVQIAVLLVIREEVAPLMSVPLTELKPLKGAPGLASISGLNLTEFGNQRDCSEAAGGQAVDAGLVIISPQSTVRSYPVAIP